MTECMTLTNKNFIRKTRQGRILKIVHEHYLRDDIFCGLEACSKCERQKVSRSCLSWPPQASISSLCNQPHFLVPDTNVVLHQIDVLEDKAFRDVIVLQTVLEEVRHRSAPAYKRIKDCLADSDKRFFTFVNEFHKDTYVARVAGESANDRNDRAIRRSVLWYLSHIDTLPGQSGPVSVVLLTNDNENKRLAREDNINAYTVHEYVRSLSGSGHSELIDKLSILPEDGDECEMTGGRIMYPEHLPLSEIQRGLKVGRYIQGTFQASRDNYLEAHVNVPDGEQVFLQGRMNLNRAVNEDVVAVELLPESDWVTPSSLIIEDNDEKPDDEAGPEDVELLKAKGSSTKVKVEKVRSGRVVGIVRRNWRQYCGVLQPSMIKSTTRHLFVPAERRIPKVRVETRQSETLTNQRIIVVIDSWPRNSRYPVGHFVRKLGEVGDKATENEVLLLEHDVPHNAFSQDVLDCLPSLPWIITEEDVKCREDLRHVCICSVDPPGCTDIDDALHCIELPNGNFQVGVHIADVSHFIRPGAAIDEEAANRGTTVYLIDKRIDMVPELLSSNLCSLRGGEERFAFSTLWEITPEANVLNVRFTKSIIKSSAALTYAEAQLKIDDPMLNNDLTKGLRRLNALAKILKQRRRENGALTLASPEIRFHIDSETHDPIDVQAKELQETNSMVEEFMLLANIYTAEKILQEFPDCAVLRRHPAPPVSNYEPIIKVAKSKGFTLDVSNGRALADSLDKAVIPSNPYFNTMLRILATRCMMQAVYFSSGHVTADERFHYGLAAPVYTHFTSPIRRYSDILVHRLLAVSIGADASYPDLLNKIKTQGICTNLNFRHRMAQYAGRASVSLHTQIFFKSRVLDEQGYVLYVRKNGLQILIPKYGLEGTVYLQEELRGSQYSFDEESSTLRFIQEDVTMHVFDPVTVQISIDASNIQHQKLALKLVTPKIANLSVESPTLGPTSSESLAKAVDVKTARPAKKSRKH